MVVCDAFMMAPSYFLACIPFVHSFISVQGDVHQNSSHVHPKFITSLLSLQTRHVLIFVVLLFMKLSAAAPQVRAVRKFYLIARPPSYLLRLLRLFPLCLAVVIVA